MVIIGMSILFYSTRTYRNSEIFYFLLMYTFEETVYPENMEFFFKKRMAQSNHLASGAYIH
jgi:hypothetical protein